MYMYIRYVIYHIADLVSCAFKAIPIFSPLNHRISRHQSQPASYQSDLDHMPR